MWLRTCEHVCERSLLVHNTNEHAHAHTDTRTHTHLHNLPMLCSIDGRHIPICAQVFMSYPFRTYTLYSHINAHTPSCHRTDRTAQSAEFAIDCSSLPFLCLALGKTSPITAQAVCGVPRGCLEGQDFTKNSRGC